MTSSPAPLVPGPRRPLAPGSSLPAGGARRTTTIDTIHPVEPRGPADIRLRGRDVVTGADGSVVSERTAALDGVVDTGGRLTALRGDLAEERIAPLLGASLRAGFGGLVARTLPGEIGRRELAASLLEDVSGGYFVSGTVLLWAGDNRIEPAGLGLVADMQGDVCAGWQHGGQQLTHLAEHLEIASPDGPPAPDLAGADDPDGWHPVTPLGPHSHRRARRLDLVPTEDGAILDAHFRDSVSDAGPERVLHEYRVSARVGADGSVGSVEVAALVLPWAECPSAAASAQRVVDQNLVDLPAFMRRELVGVETCTHLNTTLRALADAVALVEMREVARD